MRARADSEKTVSYDSWKTHTPGGSSDFANVIAAHTDGEPMTSLDDILNGKHQWSPGCGRTAEGWEP